MKKSKNSKKEDIKEELDEIREKEEKLLRQISKDINKDKIQQQKTFKEVEHFSFNDFSQILIGCCVFGLPTFINTSFWDYIPHMKTNLLFYIHAFFILAVVLALNYEFRDSISADPWFLRKLVMRFFFTYFSVFMIIVLLLILVNKMTYSLTNIEILRNYLAAQSVGMFGAVTFSFLKK